MKDIIENMALLLLNGYGLGNNIDISGTHLVKNGRGFCWSLCRIIDGRAILSVRLHKHAIPSFIINS